MKENVNQVKIWRATNYDIDKVKIFVTKEEGSMFLTERVCKGYL